VVIVIACKRVLLHHPMDNGPLLLAMAVLRNQLLVYDTSVPYASITICVQNVKPRAIIPPSIR